MRQRFEHEVSFSVGYRRLRDELNKFENDGWELVSVFAADPLTTADVGYSYDLFFKRPVEGESCGKDTNTT